MSPFSRVLKIALAQRANVVACVLTSVAVAVLWGSNLTAVFPVVDVIMNDQSLPQWVDEKIKESDREVADSRQWLEQLKELKAADPKMVPQKIQTQIDERRNELADNLRNAGGPKNDVKIAEKTRLANFIGQLETLQQVPAEKLQFHIISQIERTENHINIYSKRAERFRWMQPLVRRWMPNTPFKTLLVVCLFVLVCTVTKGLVRVWNAVLSHHLGEAVSYELRKQ